MEWTRRPEEAMPLTLGSHQRSSAAGCPHVRGYQSGDSLYRLNLEFSALCREARRWPADGLNVLDEF